MKPSDIDILVQEGEGTTLEFKETLSGSFPRELVAMANTLRARIQDIARNCDPPVTVLVEPVGRVVVIHVRESDAKPVQCSEASSGGRAR